MSTDLTTRSTGYQMTRFLRGNEFAVQVGTGWNRPYIVISVSEIRFALGHKAWEVLDNLNLLAETLVLLKSDLVDFALTNGYGMEAE
jgi:hypothetical protein